MYHVVVPTPLNWVAAEVFVDAKCSFRYISTEILFARFADFGVRRSRAPINFSFAWARRRRNDCMVSGQLPKFGGIWRYRFCAMASPIPMVRGSVDKKNKKEQ